ncbi:BlaI/MecI/CopY family transcriptional regulator [Luteolibacter flavescens]|uniref:BlaI/MecI/CopY family transcriptional regulator n=1 Tax=Luteolibacter flavescens TaxID=1859460 RepID=A0ABT3FVJ2_9BACT|nr:BlaI/MecI/CopY family transcriptional regulator [Luteolibacter flavescens]MCW1887437.1 BlaI/MecI/CopY family transcriptional regulator [Luteolibacter flavescens]
MSSKRKTLEFENLSRREREVMYVVHRLGEVSADSLCENLETTMTNSGARRILGILHDKGFLAMRKDGNRYLYLPVMNSSEVGFEMLKRTVGSFFNGSLSFGLASFLKREKGTLAPEDRRMLEEILQRADSPKKEEDAAKG